MKKLLILFLSMTIFTACSSDDDDTANGPEPIVGAWMLAEVNPALFDPQGCNEPSTVTFNENNAGSGTFYIESNECEAATSSVSWTKTNGDYTIEIPIPVVGNQQGSVDFQNNNNRFVFRPQGIPGTSLTFDRIEE